MERYRDEIRDIHDNNREIEKNYQMVNDRHKLLQKELDKCKSQLEQALKVNISQKVCETLF